MTWSYSGNPGSSDLDEVRFVIGDTDSSDPQLSNEEVTFLITRQGSVAAAALAAVHALIAKYSRLVDERTGDISLSYSQRVKTYKDLLSQLTGSGGLVSFDPTEVYAGGISQVDKLVDETDTDRVAPSFAIGMNDIDTSTEDDTVED